MRRRVATDLTIQSLIRIVNDVAAVRTADGVVYDSGAFSVQAIREDADDEHEVARTRSGRRAHLRPGHVQTLELRVPAGRWSRTGPGRAVRAVTRD